MWIEQGIEGEIETDIEAIVSLYNFSLDIAEKTNLKNTMKVALNKG